MQKKSLLLALALGFSAPLWAQDVNINGTGVSVEANKAPVHTAKNPQAIARLPANYHLAVPGKFTVAVAALNSPPLTVFSDDNKTLLGSEVDIARLMPRSAILPSPKSAKRSSTLPPIVRTRWVSTSRVPAR